MKRTQRKRMQQKHKQQIIEFLNCIAISIKDVTRCIKISANNNKSLLYELLNKNMQLPLTSVERQVR